MLAFNAKVLPDIEFMEKSDRKAALKRGVKKVGLTFISAEQGSDNPVPTPLPLICNMNGTTVIRYGKKR